MAGEQVSSLDFDAIVRDTQSHIRAYIAGMGVPRHDVDDIAQDVYVELYRFFDRVPAEVEMKQWLKGIARNLSLNYFRKTSRKSRLQREALVELFLRAEQDGSPGFAELPMRGALDKCYDKLTADSRRLLALKYEQELSSSAMAERLSSTAEAVRVALFRVRATLKDCISRSLASQKS
ncbi:RNA polymerase, sigma-24 subunit, ECF subfamily [Pirellula staleyi DSM 6068]|mgnify:CR=1 FL=1|uniref:RNA polymerase, sigma-24 subunit, ECF subfamily n=1 Tax=Pirellula staleyi (strain ATCC 27377 / DSM 6068 / ICPB 4128) TaxID=530564 RepID=D2R1X7_PIRSD|nr:sigma-70 family RNA polymerase sigma factor [Pirellula staleyi]ADB18588.1 RNA polymerase, sigma-24 subunit, ECF subfamily [Pirellula staleyi DSM 6068]